jgi:hypothetical protein
MSISSNRARGAARMSGAAGVLLALALASPAAAAGGGHIDDATTRPQPFDFERQASYLLDVRSAGIEVETALPAALYPDIGYSEVHLAHDLGQPQGTCEADGAAYWAGQYVEEAVLGFGAAPPDAGSVQGGYHNPVFSRDVKPDLSAGDNASGRKPGIVNPAPPGQEITPLRADGTPLWINSRCDNDLKGAGVGNVSDLGKTVDLVGSATEAEVNRATGDYVSTARAYVTGIQGAGNLDTVSSFMQVKQKPGLEPTITYRLSFIDANSGASNTGFNQNGFTLSGSDVPAGSLITQFNSQAKTLADAASAIGPLGFQVLAPQVGTVPSTEAGTTGLPYFTAPAIAAEAGLRLRDGTIGQDEKPRLGSITFTGVYTRNSD